MRAEATVAVKHEFPPSKPPQQHTQQLSHQITRRLVAMRVRGLTVPLVVEGAINGSLFKAWVTQHLVPTLRAGDIVVMDNLNSHKVVVVREAIAAAGAEVLDLPPYSPDLNRSRRSSRSSNGSANLGRRCVRASDGSCNQCHVPPARRW